MIDVLVALLVVLIVLGAIFYIVNYVIPMPPVFRTLVNVILGVLLLLWLLNQLVPLR